MVYTATQLLNVAIAEIGYHEKASNYNLDSKTANAGYNNYTKYARDLNNAGYFNGNKNGFHWCDVFVDWCHYMASGKVKKDAEAAEYQTGPYGAGCGYSMSYYAAAKALDMNPKPGDQIFFRWSGTSGADHTGIVEYVKDGVVHTIEGNTNNDMVERKSYAQNYKCIVGYGHPKFKAESTPIPTPVKPEIKTVDQLAREVLDGKWGNGDDRKTAIIKAGYDYNAVQNKVNELVKSTKEYKVKVTATDGLNCRLGPSTNYSTVRSAYPHGTILSISKESNGWGYTGTGWVSLQWTVKV